MRVRVKILGVLDHEECLWFYMPLCTFCGNWLGGFGRYTADQIHIAMGVSHRHLKEWHYVPA